MCHFGKEKKTNHLGSDQLNKYFSNYLKDFNKYHWWGLRSEPNIFIYFICNFFFNHVTLFSIPKKLLQIIRNKIKKRIFKEFENLSKKRIMTIGWTTKKLFNFKKCPKNAQKLKIFNLKIHKSAGMFKKTKTFLNKGTKHKKIIWEV